MCTVEADMGVVGVVGLVGMLPLLLPIVVVEVVVIDGGNDMEPVIMDDGVDG